MRVEVETRDCEIPLHFEWMNSELLDKNKDKEMA